MLYAGCIKTANFWNQNENWNDLTIIDTNGAYTHVSCSI